MHRKKRLKRKEERKICFGDHVVHPTMTPHRIHWTLRNIIVDLNCFIGITTNFPATNINYFTQTGLKLINFN
jgi:hypothetical protein